MLHTKWTKSKEHDRESLFMENTLTILGLMRKIDRYYFKKTTKR